MTTPTNNTRSDLEKNAKPISERCIEKVQRLINNARETKIAEAIDRVILIGRGSHIPAIDRIIQNLLELNVEHNNNPDLAISFGTALYTQHPDKQTKPEHRDECESSERPWWNDSRIST